MTSAHKLVRGHFDKIWSTLPDLQTIAGQVSLRDHSLFLQRSIARGKSVQRRYLYAMSVHKRTEVCFPHDGVSRIASSGTTSFTSTFGTPHSRSSVEKIICPILLAARCYSRRSCTDRIILQLRPSFPTCVVFWLAGTCVFIRISWRGLRSRVRSRALGCRRRWLWCYRRS